MTKKKVVEVIPQQEELQDRQVPPEIVKLIIENYNTAIDQQMEYLHNQFVVYISESKLPIMQVIMVLQILLKESVDMATQKYVKGE